MSKQDRFDYIMYVQQKYDSLMLYTENRGISYGELAYIESLNMRSLKALEKEIDDELDKVEIPLF